MEFIRYGYKQKTGEYHHGTRLFSLGYFNRIFCRLTLGGLIPLELLGHRSILQMQKTVVLFAAENGCSNTGDQSTYISKNNTMPRERFSWAIWLNTGNWKSKNRKQAAAIIKWRFSTAALLVINERTQREIAALFGISQVGVLKRIEHIKNFFNNFRDLVIKKPFSLPTQWGDKLSSSLYIEKHRFKRSNPTTRIR